MALGWFSPELVKQFLRLFNKLWDSISGAIKRKERKDEIKDNEEFDNNVRDADIDALNRDIFGWKGDINKVTETPNQPNYPKMIKPDPPSIFSVALSGQFPTPTITATATPTVTPTVMPEVTPTNTPTQTRVKRRGRRKIKPPSKR